MILLMVTPSNDPIGVPSDWHRFLYRSILLPWEVNGRAGLAAARFNKQCPIAGVTLVKKDSVREVAEAWHSIRRNGQPLNQLTFYSGSAALVDLVGHLRNCVAHGDYSCSKRNVIFFWHEHQGKLKLFGSVNFSKLKELIAHTVT